MFNLNVMQKRRAYPLSFLIAIKSQGVYNYGKYARKKECNHEAL